ncbi:tetratricopeptide repeat protein [Thalassobaculum sp. OXR-137]|uniref:tetratricopeptide repeat protein n=1 Tax=Thalassobaculum sp. OXR-137 TaxID=3100173 RepID=UPI002AC8C40F|nr:tetratricopeptide repeat protein [Thalassobaculum sp. OXR-137]WPZ33684.1 tetratricopeptide repeat protein [Thalassobaculum sp. OXR-137]
MADIFREVDEELQQERAATLWKKYGGWVIALCVGIVLAVAGNVFWRQYQANAQAEQAAAYATASDLLGEDKPREAAQAFAALADTGDAGYAAIARLSQAAALVEADDIPAAAETYMAIANDASVPAPYGDLARLHGVRLRIGAADAATLHGDLAPLLTPGNAWEPLARETEAAISIQQGDTDAARETLKLIADNPATPARLRQRASELLQALGG